MILVKRRVELIGKGVEPRLLRRGSLVGTRLYQLWKFLPQSKIGKNWEFRVFLSNLRVNSIKEALTLGSWQFALFDNLVKGTKPQLC